MKTCTKCERSLALDNFAKRAASKDGRCTRCRECMAVEAAANYAANRAERLRKATAQYEANKTTISEWSKRYYARNKTKIVARVRARELALKQSDETFLAGMRSRVSKRRAKRKRATPAWANDEKMREFYILADLLTKEAGHAYEVDHIVPLQSPIVCGLHWEGNLQVLPLETNRAKSNRHWPDMP